MSGRRKSYIVRALVSQISKFLMEGGGVEG